ncbi:DUF927 domain-containing protein [Sulfitobacter sp. 916]|uniref:DUF927 domain-containing protein n=1 Tax=Sulfitobacter sp. 916 TaxID=3368559 RepID=UPI003744EB6D|tara:strand:+ start:60 stop:1940 length:1881 start_codon:yes stop_codon:yes gene_type:complete
MPSTPPEPKPQADPIQRFLAELPESQKPFFKYLARTLPREYCFDRKGISVRPNGVRSVLSRQDAKPFCTPFRVKSYVEEQEGNGWKSVIEILNPDGKLVECLLPWRILDGKPNEALGVLANHGLRILNGYNKQSVLELIRTWKVSARELEVSRFGWTPDREAFALSSGRVLTRKTTEASYRFVGNADGRQIGNSAVWKESVGRLAIGNPNMLFACALGFSTALLPYATSAGSTIYHLHGRTSQGKTRVLRTALSVWPKIGEADKTWIATINGLEGEMARANNHLLGLDELPEEPPQDFSRAIYMIGNSGGKGRSTKDGTAITRQAWRTSVISTGEDSMAGTLKKLGKPPRGGQAVRMIDIPLEGAFGAFDTLHEHATADAFVKALDVSLAKAAGGAGALFVTGIMHGSAAHMEAYVSRHVTEQAAAMQDALGIVAGDTKTTEIRRVLDAFALIAVAGELVSRWGITGWPEGTATAAVQEIAKRWLGDRGNMAYDQINVLESIRDHLQQNQDRFMTIAQAINTEHDTAEIPGYQDDTYIYLLASTFALSHGKATSDAAVTYLLDANYLHAGGERNSQQYRLPKINGKRSRAYRIRKSLLEFDGKQQGSGETSTQNVVQMPRDTGTAG